MLCFIILAILISRCSNWLLNIHSNCKGCHMIICLFMNLPQPLRRWDRLTFLDQTSKKCKCTQICIDIIRADGHYPYHYVPKALEVNIFMLFSTAQWCSCIVLFLGIWKSFWPQRQSHRAGNRAEFQSNQYSARKNNGSCSAAEKCLCSDLSYVLVVKNLWRSHTGDHKILLSLTRKLQSHIWIPNKTKGGQQHSATINYNQRF